jgi:hypothetical protein
VAELRSAVVEVAAAPTVEPSPTPLPAPTEMPLPAPTEAPTLMPPTETPVVLVTLPPAPTAAPLPTPIPIQPTALPMAAAMNTGCAPSGEQYALVPYDGPAFKNNAISDENPDLRLSVLGYAPASAAPELVTYNSMNDGTGPFFNAIFQPNRIAAFAQTYQHLNWNWNEAGGPPYGTRGGVNLDWPASVVDLVAIPGERLYIPRKTPDIWSGGIVGMVLYAGERELTVAYTRQDSLDHGFVIFMSNFCVDPALVAQYRAQMQNGRRATGLLPGIRNGQTVGYATSDRVTLAIRDRAAFLDPRSRTDWWQ